MRIQAVILAGGAGKRMISDKAKCVHTLCGKPMLEYVLRSVEESTQEKPVVVVGHHAEEITGAFGDRCVYVHQSEQRGTGHAVMCARDEIEDGIVIVIAGDMPLVRAETLKKMITGVQDGASAVLLTAKAPDPTGYGRIIRSANGVERIVEQRDCTEEEKKITEISVLAYAFQSQDMKRALEEVQPSPNSGEYYVTDVVGILKGWGKRIDAIVAPYAECIGVNDRVQMADAEREMRLRILRKAMLEGAHVIDPESTYVEPDVRIGRDVIIYPGNLLMGNTQIEDGVTLYPNNRIVDSRIEEGVTVESSVILSAAIGRGTTVGPYAYIRPGTQVGAQCRIGDFVELKNASIGTKTKVSHLTYIGDADVGEQVNFGCGCVTANYDGKNKYRTVIGDRAFIGCNVNLVSPVQIGEEAYIAAGSTITQEVPKAALAIARCRQENKYDWVSRKNK